MIHCTICDYRGESHEAYSRECCERLAAEVRRLRKELTDADDCLRRIGLANHVQRAPWTELHP